LVISVDALSLHLSDEGWKQATVGVLTLLDAEGEPLRRGGGINAIRIAEMPEAGKQTIMARIEREVGALVTQRPDLEVEVVIDAAPDLRTHLLERFPKARHLTDFFHVAEHLAAALRLLFPDDDARRATERASWCHKLKHKEGTPFRLWRWLRDEMARELEPVSPWAKREIEKHAEYIYNQRAWMKYPQAVAANAAIGSGPVEAACKTLVTQRLEILRRHVVAHRGGRRPLPALAASVRPLPSRLWLHAGCSAMLRDQQVSCTPCKGLFRRGARSTGLGSRLAIALSRREFRR
jgi:hypothetical protein